MVYFASLVGGVLLSIATRLVTKIDLSPDMASATMGFVIAVTIVVALFAVWLEASAWVALLAVSATAYTVGTVTYARIIKRPPKRGERLRTVPIGALKALIVSAAVTIAGAAVPFVVLLARELLR